MQYFDQIFDPDFKATTGDGEDHDFLSFRAKIYNSFNKKTQVSHNEVFNIELMNTYDNEDYIEFKYWHDYCYGPSSVGLDYDSSNCRTKIPTVVFKKDSSVPGGFKWYRLTVVDKPKDKFKRRLF